MSQPSEPRPETSMNLPERVSHYRGRRGMVALWEAASEPSTHGGESISGQAEEVAPKKEGNR